MDENKLTWLNEDKSGERFWVHDSSCKLVFTGAKCMYGSHWLHPEWIYLASISYVFSYHLTSSLYILQYTQQGL